MHGLISTPSASELIIVLLIILLVFGGAKLPKLARSLGQAQKEFKSGLSEDVEDEESPSSKRSRVERSDCSDKLNPARVTCMLNNQSTDRCPRSSDDRHRRDRI